VQDCEILISPLFYCTKFREELEFKVRCGFSPWLFLLKKIISAYGKGKKTQKKKKMKRKRKKSKKSVSLVGNASYL